MSDGNQRSARRGLTMIEILVVIVIVALLVALTIPAVQFAREAARRVSCVNNLKQMGLALSSYEAIHKIYPAGANAGVYSAQLMILPYLDQSALYSSVNFQCDNPRSSFADGEVNATVGSTHLAVFWCPSDANADNSQTNYAWNGGFGLQVDQYVGSFASSWPVANRYTTPAQITDGLSHTAAMSEWRLGRVDTGDDVAVVFSAVPDRKKPYRSFIELCDTSSRSTTQFGAWSKDARWTDGMYSFTILNFNSGPNSHSCYYGLSIEQGNYPASSLHSDGVNVLFHDNHVKFISNSVNVNLWQGLSTKSGNDFQGESY